MSPVVVLVLAAPVVLVAARHLRRNNSPRPINDKETHP